MSAGAGWRKVGYYTGVALLWLVVGVLSIETYERGRKLLAERFYASFFEQQSRKVYRMIPAFEQAEEVLSAAPVPARGLPTPPPVDCAPPTAERESARDAFAGKNPHNKEVIATLRGEAHAHFDTEGTMLALWGDPLMKWDIEESMRRMGGPLPHSEVGKPVPVDPQQRELRPESRIANTRFPVEVSGRWAQIFTGEAWQDRLELTMRAVPPVVLPDSVPLPENQPTEIVSFRYKRNWHVPGEIASYNNYGFRDNDVVVPKPEGVYRIVCVGGSTTEEGNSNDFSYPNIMERKLKQRFGERVEVINCGISGITSYLELRRIDDYLELQPDLILYYNAINDICHEHTRRWLDAVEGWQRKLLWSAFLTRHFNRLLLPPDEALVADMKGSTFLNLRAMAYRARECGVDFAVCSFATPQPEFLSFRDRVYLDINLREVWHGEYLTYPSFLHLINLHNQLVREMCREDGLHYIPVNEELQAGMDYFLDTCHMTPPGLEVKTDIIGRHVSAIVEPALSER